MSGLNGKHDALAESSAASTRSHAMLGRGAKLVVAFLREEEGPTAVEYAVMLALILAVIFAAVGNIGSTTNSMYGDLSLKGVKPP